MESLPLGALVSRAPAPGWEKSPDMEDSTLHPQSGELGTDWQGESRQEHRVSVTIPHRHLPSVA